MRPATRAIVLLVLLGACSSPRLAARSASPPPAPRTEAGESPVAVVAPPPVCTEPSPLVADRARAIDELLGDHAEQAVVILEEIAKRRPQELASEALRKASQAKLAKANARTAEEQAALAMTALEALPLARTLVGEAKLPRDAQHVRLVLEQEKPNLIVDTDDWFKSNGLAQNTTRGPLQRLPAHVAASFRSVPLRALFAHVDHHVAFYAGGVLVASAAGKRPRVFDATRAMGSERSFDVDYAQLVGGTLLVSVGINGYARNVRGKTGYVVAFDAESGRLLWSSDPLTSNAQSFLVLGRSIVSGYGFTAEPDFLFVIDAASGAVEQKIPLKSGPSAIAGKSDKVFVRAYATDYVFRNAGPLPAAMPADLAEISADAPPDHPETRCWANVAAAAIDRRDARALALAIEAMHAFPSDRFLDDAFRDTLRFLLGQERGPRKIDLSTSNPLVLAAPPWSYALTTTPAPPSGRPPLLFQVKKAKSDPVRALAQRPYRPDRASYVAPVARGALPAGAPPDIPSSYAMEDLRAIIPDEDRLLLVYGGRYLAILHDRVPERIFDMDAFRHPPSPDPQWKEFAVEDVTHAAVRDGVAYVCNGGGSYARDVRGKKGFLSAIEVASGKLLWRSDPLVCNASFVLVGDYLVSGYGFTAEPDYLYVLRRGDGKTMSRTRVDSGPDEIRREGSRLLVETYDASYAFELR